MSKYKWKTIKKIGLGIIAFEGTEHLANIITELRDIVDYVSIGLQRKSYHGDDIHPTDLDEIFRLRDEDHLVDNILEVNLDLDKAPRQQEVDKRNMLIQDAEDHGCSHVIIIDSDEFYTHNSFLKAVQEIDENDYELTYCQYINYFHDYQHMMLYPFKEGMYVPFVSKTKYRFYFEYPNGYNKENPNDPAHQPRECVDFTLPSDPTRRYVRPYDRVLGKFSMPNGQIYEKKHYTVEYHVFPWNVVKMHHLSMLRADIRKKFNTWSSKMCFDNYNDLIDRALFNYNNFDENNDAIQKISLLFGTPNNEINVKKLPKQYIYPKYDFRTRLRVQKQYKKILVLNMSSTNSSFDLFNKLDKCSRETWAKDIIDGKYENIDYYTTIDTDKQTRIDEKNKVVYIHKDKDIDNTIHMYDRFIESSKLLLKKKKYDYIIRVNSSTWLNIDLLNEFLANETDDSKIYTHSLLSGYYSLYYPWMSGCLFMMASKYIGIIEKEFNALNDSTKTAVNDDIIISAVLRVRMNNLTNTDNGWKIFNSLEGKYLWKHDSLSKIKDNLDYSVPSYQVKDFELINDPEKQFEIESKRMKYLTEDWNKHKSTLNIEELEHKLRYENLNKNIYCILYTKQDHQEMVKNKDHEIAITQFKNPLPLNDDTIRLLKSYAHKSGYNWV